MSVPVTSDLEGYQRYWSRWLRRFLIVLGVGFATCSWLLYSILEAIRR
jgi:hypothetical protein